MFEGMAQLSQYSQSVVNSGMVNVGMVNTARGAMINSNQMPMQQFPAHPNKCATVMVNRPPPQWPMLPPQQVQKQSFMSQPQVNTTQGSALIAQLTQPPSSVSGSGVNQFGQSKFAISHV